MEIHDVMFSCNLKKKIADGSVYGKYYPDFLTLWILSDLGFR